MTVVIITDRFDPTADLVATELNNRGSPLFRFDTAEFPAKLTATAQMANGEWSGELRSEHRALDLRSVTGLYYRRPSCFQFAPDLSDEERRWAGVQARLGLGGLLSAVDPWLNHPHRIGFAEYKPVQLRAATAVGLSVPRTLVTNDPEAARRFVAAVGSVICKPFGATGIVEEGGQKQLFAAIVGDPSECDDSIVETMHLFQENVAKDHEVRLTAVDGLLFAARIDARSDSARVDWRRDYEHLDYAPTRVPQGVADAIRDYLCHFGLRFGAFDFVVDSRGEWWFLECNPNGQWAWIEDATGLPIAAAIADALQGPFCA